MKSYKIFATAVLMSLCAVLPVQAQKSAGPVEQYEYEFNPHFFVQGQVGGQYTLGELKFADLLSPNIQLAGGYEFNPWLAARLSFDFWQSKAGFKLGTNANTYKWKWSYLAPSVDAMIDLTNLIGGFNPERKISAGVLGGIGANIVFNKDEANTARNNIIAAYPLANPGSVVPYYDETGPFLAFRFGAFADWHLTDNLALGLEFQSNVLSDKYNSKKASPERNSDWYFNALAGVKYCFGETYQKRVKDQLIPISEAHEYVPCPEPEEKIVEKIVEKPVAVVTPMLYEEIYYEINKDKVSAGEKYKLRRIIDFMKEYPEAKIEIAGHADKATGTSEYNMKISQRRADNVAKALKDAGIDESRISVSYHGSNDNIYQGADMKLNRVTICEAK